MPHEAKQLLDSADYLSILQVLDEGVILVDRRGRILFYNDAQGRIDDKDPSSVLGLHPTEVYQLTEDTSLIMVCLRTRQPIVNRHLVYKTHRGRIVNSLCSVFPLFRDGTLTGAVCFVRDYNLLENTITSICSCGVSEPPLQRGNGTRFAFPDLVGGDPAFERCVKVAKMAALTPSPVMLAGETGTGKELFAQSIHNYGPRKERPYVAINCAAIPENLLEGILFGTVKGSFTGAVDKQGLLEKASGGTLFLDEVNSMPLGLQAKLLRVIQERRVRRVGALEEREVDLKVLSSVNEDPHAAVERGRMRLDLFYRLGVVVVRLPPLRERRSDIAELVRLFVDKHNAELGRHVAGLSPGVVDLFAAYDWPGNVRELEHVVEGAMNVMGERTAIDLGDLPPYLVRHRAPKGEGAPPAAPPREETPAERQPPPLPRDLPRSQAEREREAVVGALTESGGNVSQAARRLGISRQLLRYKMNKYGLGRGDFGG